MNTTAPGGHLAFLLIGSSELAMILLIWAGIGFWLWMLVDCLTQETDQNHRLIWALAIVLVGFVGAPLYFFVRKLPRVMRRPPSDQSSPPGSE